MASTFSSWDVAIFVQPVVAVVDWCKDVLIWHNTAMSLSQIPRRPICHNGQAWNWLTCAECINVWQPNICVCDAIKNGGNPKVPFSIGLQTTHIRLNAKSTSSIASLILYYSNCIIYIRQTHRIIVKTWT